MLNANYSREKKKSIPVAAVEILQLEHAGEAKQIVPWDNKVILVTRHEKFKKTCQRLIEENNLN